MTLLFAKRRRIIFPSSSPPVAGTSCWPGTWAQFGIPGNPELAQVWRNRSIPDDPRILSNLRGTVAYAFKDPNGRTTQVFINLRDNSATHDHEPFVPFARVIKGMEVADSLYSGYGERSGGGIRTGKQDSLFSGGNDYLQHYFPLLDSINQARVVPAGHRTYQNRSVARG